MGTVKVRIAVAVDSKGAWVANGWGYQDGGDPVRDEEFINVVLDDIDSHSNYSLSIVSAELPIPEAVEIRGTVERLGEG